MACELRVALLLVATYLAWLAAEYTGTLALKSAHVDTSNRKALGRALLFFLLLIALFFFPSDKTEP